MWSLVQSLVHHWVFCSVYFYTVLLRTTGRETCHFAMTIPTRHYPANGLWMISMGMFGLQGPLKKHGRASRNPTRPSAIIGILLVSRSTSERRRRTSRRRDSPRDRYRSRRTNAKYITAENRLSIIPGTLGSEGWERTVCHEADSRGRGVTGDH